LAKKPSDGTAGGGQGKKKGLSAHFQINTMPGGTSRRKDVPGPSWDGVNELALAAFTAGVAGVCMAREDIFFFVYTWILFLKYLNLHEKIGARTYFGVN
jgi:hypothetical protein